MIDLITPVNHYEYQQMIFLAKVFGAIAVSVLAYAIANPEEW